MLPRNPCFRLSRRRFLATGASGLAAFALTRKQSASGDGGGVARPVLAKVRCDSLLQDGVPDVGIAYAMLDRAALDLFGRPLPDALATLVSVDDVVGLKVNCLAGFELSTNFEVVEALARGLVDMGLPESNIVVWDRFEDHLTRCFYPLNNEGAGLRCYGADAGPGGGLDHGAVYESGLGDGQPSYFYRVATQHVTKIINMPVPKDHNCSGVTGALKNLGFGAINNTARFHPAPHFCDPMIAEVCAHPAIRDKVVLHVMDASRGLFDGGPVVGNPAAVFEQNELWVSRDPVAMDTALVALLDSKRAEDGLPPIGEGGPPAKHIATAAALGLGRLDLDESETVFSELAPA